MNMKMLWAIVLSAGLPLLLTPFVIKLAWMVGAVDVPRDWRRMHHVSVPRIGGIAIYTGFAVGCMVLGKIPPLLSCTLSGGALMLAVGLADDLFCLGAWSKLVFQIIAATAAVLGSGIFSGWNALLPILWVLALTNAHNFIDGLDGLFAGCAAIEGGFLALTFLLSGRGAGLPPLLLSLSCVCFRAFNRHPAKIFAGDCGSGSVGFALGMLSLPLLLESLGTVGILTPILIFAYPLVDLIAAVLRRLLRGKSPFSADRGHLHHRICAVGLSQVACGRLLLSVCAVLGFAGTLLCTEDLYLPCAMVCLAAALWMMQIRRFVVDFRSMG